MSGKITADRAFELIMLKFHKYNDFSYMLDTLCFDSRRSNFIGGSGDIRTTHEKVFGFIYPKFKKQVPFGTGKDGYKKYGTKRYIADFYDHVENVIYEIDGNSHKREIDSIKDKIRDYFFYHERGIRTIRLTNKDVENHLMNVLKELEQKGVLADALGLTSKSDRGA